ncbi:MAG TPA: response regulator transcription factor [Hyphomicrobiaceae bacterium]|jgi:DNA-binding NarL/FixJ family response regulator|nr:response regulator transcription factor [Hyphomicrobiaceae bacterium]
MSDYRFIIVDDHPLFRGALSQALRDAFDKAEVLEAGSLDELIERLAAAGETDLILLDLTMPGVHGVSGLLYLRAQNPEVPVVIVSASDDAATIRQCLDCGASGFIPKSQPVEKIREAIRKVIGGEVWLPPDTDLNNLPSGESAELVSRLSTLTPQQVRVLMMLGEGLLNKQIAFKLGVSEATIKAHVSAILQKLGVDSRTQAVIAINKIGGTTDWPRLPN